MAISLEVTSCVFTLLAVFIATAKGTLVHSSCPIPGSQDSFVLNQYLGTWYEYERFSAWFELGVKCGSAVYGTNDDGSISVINGGYRNIHLVPNNTLDANVPLFGVLPLRRTNFGFKMPTSITGRATVPDPSKPAELRVSFSRFDRSTGDANYFIVETDYINYTVVFSCSDLPGGFSIQYAWILTRERGVAPSNLAAIKSNLQSFGVDLSNFNSVDQSDCQGY